MEEITSADVSIHGLSLYWEYHLKNIQPGREGEIFDLTPCFVCIQAWLHSAISYFDAVRG